MSREFQRKVWGLIFEEAEGKAPEGRKASGEDRVASELTMLDVTSIYGATVDLVEGQPIGHAQRVAYIAQEVGSGLGLEGPQMADITFGSLLHDLGLLKITHELGDISGTPEQELLTTHALDAVEDLSSHVRQGNIEKLSALLIQHAQEGSRIVADLPVSRGVAGLVEGHHEHYDGHGYPSGTRGDAIPLAQRIVTGGDCLGTAIAQAGERGHSPEFVRAESMKFSNKQLDQEIAKELMTAAQNVRFWGTFTGGGLARQLQSRIPVDQNEITYGQIAHMFKTLVDLVDAKSPYRAGHSWSVARNTYLMALELGMTEDLAASLGMASLVHDLGKAGVANQILDKPKWLTGPEYEVAKKHIGYTDRILSYSGNLFDEIRGWILHHHERLDGSGYPNRLKGDQIGREVRVIATADVYDALISDRPYRKGLDAVAAVRFMEGKVNRYFDPEVLGALSAVVTADA